MLKITQNHALAVFCDLDLSVRSPFLMQTNGSQHFSVSSQKLLNVGEKNQQ